jgi:hypothetical protein
LLEVAFESANTVPIATPAPTTAPTFISSDRERLCFAGATAAPAGWEAATPLGVNGWAAAVPKGLEGVCGLGGAGVADCIVVELFCSD